MKISTIQEAFPDLNFDSLTQSKIPRIRILFKKKNFRGMQKDLMSFLDVLFVNKLDIFTLNQIYESKGKQKIHNLSYGELENLGLGSLYKNDDSMTEVLEEVVIHNRIFHISFELLIKISIIDAWGRTVRGKRNGLPFIEMDNILFSGELTFLMHVNFILLDNPDQDGIDIVSYDKKYLYQLAELYKNLNFNVLLDKVEDFN